MHDCGHGSLFESPRLNRIFGFLLGVVNAVPQLSWSIDHAYHHKTNGDWQKYRGVADFLSLEEFQNLSRKEQRSYAIVHHPLMAITDRPISPVEVAEAMPDEFGDNGRQKALQALDALFRKRLVEKIKRSDGKRGVVVVFQPLKERRCP